MRHVSRLPQYMFLETDIGFEVSRGWQTLKAERYMKTLIGELSHIGRVRLPVWVHEIRNMMVRHFGRYGCMTRSVFEIYLLVYSFCLWIFLFFPLLFDAAEK